MNLTGYTEITFPGKITQAVVSAPAQGMDIERIK